MSPGVLGRETGGGPGGNRLRPTPEQDSPGQSPSSPPVPPLLLGRAGGGCSLTKAIGERGKEEVDSMLWPQPDPTRGQPSPAASGGRGGGPAQLLSVVSQVLHPPSRTFLPFHLVRLKPTLSFKPKPSPTSSRKSPHPNPPGPLWAPFLQQSPLGAQHGYD